MSRAHSDDEAADDADDAGAGDATAPVVFRQLLGVRIFLIVCAALFTIVALSQVADKRTAFSMIAAMVVIVISYGAVLSAVRERVEIRPDDTVRVVRLIGAEQVQRRDIRAVLRHGAGSGGRSACLELVPPTRTKKSMKPSARGGRGAPDEPSAHERLGGVLALPMLDYQGLADALDVEYLSGADT